MKMHLLSAARIILMAALFLVLLIATGAHAQTLFDGGAAALPIQKINAHPISTPLNQTFTAQDFNSLTNNIFLLQQVLLGDAGFPAYPLLLATVPAPGCHVAYDCDFTAQPFASVDAGAGSYLLCPNPLVGLANVQWATQDYTGNQWPIEVDGGQGGLILSPVNGSSGGATTSPGITTNLLQFYPDAGVDTGWNVTWYESDNVGSNYQFCQMQVADLPSLAGSSNMTLLTHRSNTGVHWGVQTSYGGNPVGNAEATSAAHVIQLRMPKGYMGAISSGLVYSVIQPDAGWVWPGSAGATPWTIGGAQGAGPVSGIAPLSQWGITLIGANNGGSGGLQCKTRRLTIEVCP
jgi:hypothetical protein